MCDVYWYSIQQPLNRSGYASQSRVECTMHDVCVFVCKCVYLCSKVPGHFIPRTYLPMPFLAFCVLTSPHAVKSPVRYHTSSYRPFRSSSSLPALQATHGFIIPPLLTSPLDTPESEPPCGHLPSSYQRPLFTRGDGDGGERGRQKEQVSCSSCLPL